MSLSLLNRRTFRAQHRHSLTWPTLLDFPALALKALHPRKLFSQEQTWGTKVCQLLRPGLFPAEGLQAAWGASCQLGMKKEERSYDFFFYSEEKAEAKAMGEWKGVGFLTRPHTSSSSTSRIRVLLILT